MTTHKITLHSALGRDDLHSELLELHERLKLYGVCVVMESTEAEGLNQTPNQTTNTSKGDALNREEGGKVVAIHLTGASPDKEIRGSEQTQILEWKEKAKVVDAYLNCPGNCEGAWHDCGCALFDALRGSEQTVNEDG